MNKNLRIDTYTDASGFNSMRMVYLPDGLVATCGRSETVFRTRARQICRRNLAARIREERKAGKKDV